MATFAYDVLLLTMLVVSTNGREIDDLRVKLLNKQFPVQAGNQVVPATISSVNENMGNSQAFEVSIDFTADNVNVDRLFLTIRWRDPRTRQYEGRGFRLGSPTFSGMTSIQKFAASQALAAFANAQ